MPDHHPSVQHVLQFFKFDHLPPRLKRVSQPFAELAALRKLLESKDAAVRAVLAELKA